MAPRRIPSIEEKNDIITGLRATREKYGQIAACLRELAPEISRLRKLNMTWQTIGDMLTNAGITYQTGRPWSARILRKKFSEYIEPIHSKPTESLSTIREIDRPPTAQPPQHVFISSPDDMVLIPGKPRRYDSSAFEQKPLTPEQLARREALRKKLL